MGSFGYPLGVVAYEAPKLNPLMLPNGGFIGDGAYADLARQMGYDEATIAVAIARRNPAPPVTTIPTTLPAPAPPADFPVPSNLPLVNPSAARPISTPPEVVFPTNLPIVSLSPAAPSITPPLFAPRFPRPLAITPELSRRGTRRISFQQLLTYILYRYLTTRR